MELFPLPLVQFWVAPVFAIFENSINYSLCHLGLRPGQIMPVLYVHTSDLVTQHTYTPPSPNFVKAHTQGAWNIHFS